MRNRQTLLWLVAVCILILALLAPIYMEKGDADSNRKPPKRNPRQVGERNPFEPNGKHGPILPPLDLNLTEDNTPGILEVPGLGPMQYARRRSFNLQAFVRKECPELEKSMPQDQTLSFPLTVYEDAKGYLLHIEHGTGNYPTSDRGKAALTDLEECGIHLVRLGNHSAKMDNPRFVEELLSKLLAHASDLHKSEVSATCVTYRVKSDSWVDDVKDTEIPGIMLQVCLGAPPPPWDAPVPSEVPWEDAVWRHWLLYGIYEETDGKVNIGKPDGGGGGGGSFYERRADGIRNSPSEDPRLRQK